MSITSAGPLQVQQRFLTTLFNDLQGHPCSLHDANNYYVVRANALEDNYNLYKVVNGQRREIKGSNVKVTSGEWHELRVEVPTT